jgi:PAS domain S-box-containing protein
MVMSATKLTVLNVDDYDANRYARSSVLKRAGFHVIEAATGREALRLIDEQKPQLVVLDVNLPDISGLEVCQRIKAGSATSAVMVLQMSASLIDPKDRAHALESGADSFLIEPVDPEELIATVRALLRLSSAEEGLRESETLWRTLFEVANDVMLLLDDSYTVVAANENAIEMYGYPRQELIGMSHLMLRSPLERNNLPEQFQRARENERNLIETEHLNRDKQIIPVEVSVRHLSTTDGPRFLLVVRDLTERHEMEFELGKRVDERTAQLMDLNVRLRSEIERREDSEIALRGAYEQLRRVAARLEAVREEERVGIARELHDELGQSMTALKLDLRWLENTLAPDQAVSARIEEMRETIDASINTIRRISSDLRPNMLDELGLVPAIEWKAQDFAQRTGIECYVDLMTDDPPVTPERATAIFRILQEALTNVIRHAHATRVDVMLHPENNRLTLKVHDNGSGMDENTLTNVKSLGILGMQERAVVVGGELDLKSEANNGTTLTLRIPLETE